MRVDDPIGSDEDQSSGAESALEDRCRIGEVASFYQQHVSGSQTQVVGVNGLVAAGQLKPGHPWPQQRVQRDVPAVAKDHARLRQVPPGTAPLADEGASVDRAKVGPAHLESASQRGDASGDTYACVRDLTDEL